MEKFTQFRDRGSGIAPFIPITTPSSKVSIIPRVFLFLLRLVPFILYVLVYFLFLQFLPLPMAVRKLLLWGMMSIPGIWWVDLQIDGVKRGHLSQQLGARVPYPGSIIASSFTSPLDALYLAAVFDPIFTISYPNSTKLRCVSLFSAITQALSHAQLSFLQPKSANDRDLTDLRTLLAMHHDRIIVVFPECATTNGKAVLPLSPSLLSAPLSTPIFPLSMRYSPSDITTPVPGTCFLFLWNLLSRPTHYIRVRIAEGVMISKPGEFNIGARSSATDWVTSIGKLGSSIGDYGQAAEDLECISEALARLGRNKRVGLTLQDKAAFLEAWSKKGT